MISCGNIKKIVPCRWIFESRQVSLLPILCLSGYRYRCGHEKKTTYCLGAPSSFVVYLPDMLPQACGEMMLENDFRAFAWRIKDRKQQCHCTQYTEWWRTTKSLHLEFPSDGQTLGMDGGNLCGQLNWRTLGVEFVLQSPRKKRLQVGLRLGVRHFQNHSLEVFVRIHAVRDASLDKGI